MPNFKKLAKNYENNATVALQQFVRIDSHYDATTIKENQPYGAGVKKALDYFAKLGTDFGYKVDKCNGYCTEITIGEEGPIIGIYGHSDVVPVSGKWSVPPFGATIKDGKLIGRGAIDDKGPLIAALYGAKLLKDNGLVKGYRIRVVSGGDEERGSSCLKYYFHTLKKEDCDFGFTPDADFPLIFAEKGMLGYNAVLKDDLSPIIAMDGGVVANAVCDRLLVTIKKDPEFEKFIEGLGKEADVENLSSSLFTMIAFKGKTAHGSTPEKGDNAALKAFKILGKFYKKESLLKLADTLSDCNGRNFNGFNESKVLGKTTYNFGIFNYANGVLSFTIDFRFGEECDGEKMIANLAKALPLELVKRSEHQHLLYDLRSPLVATLMKSYKKSTHKFFAKPLAIGGGTYAKEAKNTVAFGACIDGDECNMHSPDEYIILKNFYDDIEIYARAIYMLGEMAKKRK
ncbi:MAG: Sapep family Mn(2+)-dependent dipeptidase [Bacilli bacterium]|nr:Sapep family Mn(2+)-dependent dipeptidase [Bacilli bacterium]